MTPWLTPPSYRHKLHTTPQRRMKSSSALWQRLSTSSGSNGLHLRNHLAGWTSGFFRGAIRLCGNAHPPSSLKYTTSSRNRGAPPTHLASVLLLQMLSHPLTALKKKDTSTCLLWMSLWPHISARHPSKPCRATSALAGRPRPSPTQQTTKQTPTTPEPQSPVGRWDRGHKR